LAVGSVAESGNARGIAPISLRTSRSGWMTPGTLVGAFPK
jgi:hypothetical protein